MTGHITAGIIDGLMPQKTIIFLGDGMADEPIPELDGRTPLQAASTPGMDRIAREGRSGTLFTLPEAFPTSSEVANMSVLGCDLASEYCGRGPLEAAGRGIPLGPEDIAFRLNLTTVEDGVLRDFSGGHLDQAVAESIIETLNSAFGSRTVRFEAGVSYRNLLILSGSEFSPQVTTEKPDDNQGQRLADHLPQALSSEAEPTALFLKNLMMETQAVLEAHPANRKLVAAGALPANGLWPWNGGRAGALRSLSDKYGIASSAVISAVDVIMGLGQCLGMDVIRVPGATGYIDTNYEGKGQAAIDALDSHDFVYLHVEAIDEVSHEQNLELKLRAIEDFDSRIIVPVLNAVDDTVNTVVLPDHPVPLALGKHTRTPVPVSARIAGHEPDPVQLYSEQTCPQGALGAMSNGDLMATLFGPPRDA